ncbi:MAG: hypothetical protein HDS73_07645 [Bacteroidales bacterium]|nr:hypothetical protein [Bacteroidales bacterium]
MKRIISIFMVAAIALLALPTTADAAAPKKKAKARTTTTARKSSSATSATIQWIDGEIPSPKALCEYYFDGKGTAQMEKALKSKGYAYSDYTWEKEMVAYFRFDGGRWVSTITIGIVPADLYNNYLQAAKTYCKSKGYTLTEDKANGEIRIDNE